MDFALKIYQKFTKRASTPTKKCTQIQKRSNFAKKGIFAIFQLGIIVAKRPIKSDKKNPLPGMTVEFGSARPEAPTLLHRI